MLLLLFPCLDSSSVWTLYLCLDSLFLPSVSSRICVYEMDWGYGFSWNVVPVPDPDAGPEPGSSYPVFPPALSLSDLFGFCFAVGCRHDLYVYLLI